MHHDSTRRTQRSGFAQPNVRIEHCTEVRFASFLSGGFITAIVVNPPERKLAKRTSVLSSILWIFQSIFCWMTEFLKNSNWNSILQIITMMILNLINLATVFYLKYDTYFKVPYLEVNMNLFLLIIFVNFIFISSICSQRDSVNLTKMKIPIQRQSKNLKNFPPKLFSRQ